MVLRKVRLVNFKSHARSELELRKVNLLIGPNNSGKSAFIHALQLLRQTLYSGQDGALVPQRPGDRTTTRNPTAATFGFPNRAIDVGEFSDIIRRDASRLELHIEGAIPSKEGDIDIRYASTFANNVVVRSTGSIAMRRAEISWDAARRDRQSLDLKIGQITGHFHADADAIGKPIRSSGRGHNGDVTPEQELRADEVQASIENAIPTLLRSIHTAYGIRGFEEVGYHVTHSPPHFEYQLLDDRALAISSAFPYNRAFEEDASEWLEKVLGVRVVFEMVGDKRVVLRVRPSSGVWRATPIINEGLGLHQLMFMLLPIAITPPHGTVLIEEPEAHLHPKAQVAVANLIIETARKNSKQFICTTHGEHVLLGCLSAIRQGRLQKDDLAIFHVTKDEHGESRVSTVEFDERGLVRGGLPGFFDQDAAEMLDSLGGHE